MMNFIFFILLLKLYLFYKPNLLNDIWLLLLCILCILEASAFISLKTPLVNAFTSELSEIVSTFLPVLGLLA
jgi:c-di-AMP phosphodiesterase-like protein